MRTLHYYNLPFYKHTHYTKASKLHYYYYTDASITFLCTIEGLIAWKGGAYLLANTLPGPLGQRLMCHQFWYTWEDLCIALQENIPINYFFSYVVCTLGVSPSLVSMYCEGYSFL